MKRTAMRRAAAVAAVCAATLLGGCGDNSGPEDVSGAWEGSLTLNLAGGGALAGDLDLVLTQDDSFASGGLTWAPIGETLSVAGPIDGVDITLRILFRCEDTFETAVIEGRVDGDSIDIDEASGKACALDGAPVDVVDGSGSLTRASDGAPF